MSVVERLVPDTVAVASTRAELLDGELFDEERAAVGHAVESRRREFATGRACARKALAQLEIAPVAILSGERGEPIWPDGVVGSITHCAGYRAGAVARAVDVRSLGIDAEVHRPLSDGVRREIAFGPERAMLAARRHGIHLDAVLFSAKEAVYKAWFPLTHRWLGFEDAELAIDLAAATFHARLLIPGPIIDGEALTGLSGRWAIEDGIVAAAVIVP